MNGEMVRALSAAIRSIAFDAITSPRSLDRTAHALGASTRAKRGDAANHQADQRQSPDNEKRQINPVVELGSGVIAPWSYKRGCDKGQIHA
jgi:hypothetical protein